MTPSVLFGNPGGSLTAGTVHFVRPSTCAAYAPALSNAYPFTSTLSGSYPVSEKLEITNIELYQLDPRLMLNFIFQAASSYSYAAGELGVLTYQNPGPYAFSGVAKWQTPATSNSASAEFAKDGLYENNDYQNSGFFIGWNAPSSYTTIEAALTLALSAPAGTLCNDTAPVPTSLTPVDMNI